jgi:hypothetical protein
MGINADGSILRMLSLMLLRLVWCCSFCCCAFLDGIHAGNIHHPLFVVDQDPTPADRKARVAQRVKERNLIDLIYQAQSKGVDETDEIKALLTHHKVGLAKHKAPSTAATSYSQHLTPICTLSWPNLSPPNNGHYHRWRWLCLSLQHRSIPILPLSLPRTISLDQLQVNPNCMGYGSKLLMQASFKPPLQLAVLVGHLPAASVLLDHGADQTRQARGTPPPLTGGDACNAWQGCVCRRTSPHFRE